MTDGLRSEAIGDAAWRLVGLLVSASASASALSSLDGNVVSVRGVGERAAALTSVIGLMVKAAGAARPGDDAAERRLSDDENDDGRSVATRRRARRRAALVGSLVDALVDAADGLPVRAAKPAAHSHTFLYNIRTGAIRRGRRERRRRRDGARRGAALLSGRCDRSIRPLPHSLSSRLLDSCC